MWTLLNDIRARSLKASRELPVGCGCSGRVGRLVISAEGWRRFEQQVPDRENLDPIPFGRPPPLR
jgi:hypothetical protein